MTILLTMVATGKFWSKQSDFQLRLAKKLEKQIVASIALQLW